MPYKHGFLARGPFPVTFVQQVAAGSLLTSHALFTNPLANKEYYDLLGIDTHYDVVSSSGTADLRRVPVSTAFTGGVTLLATAANIDLTATARTSRKASLAATATLRRILPGDALTLIFAGTLTGLVGFNITVWLQAMRGIRGR